MEKTNQHMPQHNRYEWQADSPLSKVTVRTDQKYPTAFIEASESADATLFERLPKLLEQNGMRHFADEFEGKQVLRVWGFENDAQLLQALAQANATRGPSTQTEHAPKKDLKVGDWIKDNSVMAAGMTYLVGDGLLLASGLVRKEGNQITSAMQWGATSLLLTLFGTKDPTAQMDRLYRHMDDYLEKSDFELSNEDRKILTRLRKGGDGAWADMKHLLSEHVITLNNIIFGLGGINMAKAGVTQDKNMFKAGAGAAVTGGMWGSLLIPEDDEAGMSREEVKEKHEAEKRGETFEGKPVDAFQQPWTWLKRKPLRLAGMGAGLNNVLMGVSGWIYEFPKRREALKAAVAGTEEHFKAKAAMQGAIYDGLTPGAYVVANTFYSMSPKDRRGFLREDGYLSELYTVAAHIFAELPKEEQALRVSQFSGFLSAHPEMKSSSEEIQDAIEEKIDSIAKSPWHKASVKTHAPSAEISSQELAYEKPLALAQQQIAHS